MKSSDIPALERALIDIDKLEREIQEAIKDEKDAQTMYANIVRSAENFRKTESVSLIGLNFSCRAPLNDTARTTQEIIRDESAHERKFTAMLSGMGTLKQRVRDKITEVQKKEDEARRAAAKLSEGYHGPFRLRK